LNYAWRIALVIIGLLFIRRYLYKKYWGHGGFLGRLVGIVIGLAFFIPLYRFDPQVALIMLAAGSVLFLPFGSYMKWKLKKETVKGLQQIASEWNMPFIDDSESGLFHTKKIENENEHSTMWIGNVGFHMRSIHPAVRTEETYWRLAFVIRLDALPPFQCSLIKGYTNPSYFEREWRKSTTIKGEMTMLNHGEMLEDDHGTRSTGGKVDTLQEYDSLDDRRWEQFHGLSGTHQERFIQVFSREILEDFFLSASSSPQYEMNITPTSLNILTFYCRGDVQKRHLQFLIRLKERLQGTTDNC